MKFSSCVTHPAIINQPFETIVEKFVEFGFDAIDIPGDSERFPPVKVKDILSSYSDKLKTGELTAMMNPSLDLVHPDEKIRRKAIDYVKYCIQAAAEIGSDITHMCFLSYEENLKTTLQQKLDEYARAAVKECCKEAEDYDIEFMVEPLFEGDVSIVNRCDQAVNLLSSALDLDKELLTEGKTRYGLLQDVFHMHCEEKDILSTIESYYPMTYHVHVADHPRGLDFDREDSLFVKDALKKYKQLNYNRLVSFESFADGISLETLGNSLKTLKNQLK